MGLLKGNKHEFGFVPGFGDSVRDAVDYGLPERVAELIKEEHPKVVVVSDITSRTDKWLVFARGDNGSLFFLFDIPIAPGPVDAGRRLLARLDAMHYRGRHTAEKDIRRSIKREFDAYEARTAKADADAVANAADPDEVHYHASKVIAEKNNRPAPFRPLQVTADLGG